MHAECVGRPNCSFLPWDTVMRACPNATIMWECDDGTKAQWWWVASFPHEEQQPEMPRCPARGATLAREVTSAEGQGLPERPPYPGSGK